MVDDVGLSCIELESEVTAAIVGNALKGDVEDVGRLFVSGLKSTDL